jgi:hypothetical protein
MATRPPPTCYYHLLSALPSFFSPGGAQALIGEAQGEALTAGPRADRPPSHPPPRARAPAPQAGREGEGGRDRAIAGQKPRPRRARTVQIFQLFLSKAPTKLSQGPCSQSSKRSQSASSQSPSPARGPPRLLRRPPFAASPTGLLRTAARGNPGGSQGQPVGRNSTHA